MTVVTDIHFSRCHPDAITPSQSVDDVGFDIHSVDELMIAPGERAMVATGIKLANVVWHPSRRTVPFFKIEGRSGLAAKHGVFPIGCIIDPSYRGEIRAILFNSGREPFDIYNGDRIAQLVCYLTMSTNVLAQVCWKEVDWQAGSKRDDKGFGSSGR